VERLSARNVKGIQTDAGYNAKNTQRDRQGTDARGAYASPSKGRHELAVFRKNTNSGGIWRFRPCEVAIDQVALDQITIAKKGDATTVDGGSVERWRASRRQIETAVI